jgi:hypothetical protein
MNKGKGKKAVIVYIHIVFMLIRGNIGGGGLVWFSTLFSIWNASRLETGLRRGESCVLFMFPPLGLANSRVSPDESNLQTIKQMQIFRHFI